MNFLSLLFCF